MRDTCPAGIHPARPVTHRWRIVLAAGVLLSALPLHAAADDCDASSQADRLDCLQRVAEASARELLDAASALATAVDRWDENAMHRDQARQRLPTGSKAFAGYRAAHGALDRSLAAARSGRAWRCATSRNCGGSPLRCVPRRRERVATIAHRPAHGMKHPGPPGLDSVACGRHP
jgi:hypothetical protein